MDKYFKDTAEKRAFIQESFNQRLESWYLTVNQDYEVNGYGFAHFDKLPREVSHGCIVFDFNVFYEENGHKFHSVFSATDEQLHENNVDWLFNIWAEGSMPTTKAVQSSEELSTQQASPNQ